MGAEKNLEIKLLEKDKIIDLMADELRYQNGMGQDDLFCYDICKNYEYCDKEICKDRIRDFFTKKAEGEIQNEEK